MAYLLNKWYCTSFLTVSVFDKKKDAVALLRKEGFKHNKREDVYYNGEDQYTLTKIERNIL